jgi:3-hydroxybutyryl-CoA dehydrogenase
VVVYSPLSDREELADALEQIELECDQMVQHGVCSSEALGQWRQRYQGATAADALAPSDFIIESVIEDMDAKGRVYDLIENVVGPSVTIASNSSAIPPTLIQQGRKHPERFVSMHWATPAHNRFLEITPGAQTDPRCVSEAAEIAHRCRKEPAILKKDVRGFLANRMMYALFREAISLLEAGIADVEMIDRAFQNDIGAYAALAGPFRLMDLTGIPAYAAVMKDLFPELSTSGQLPKTMQKLVEAGANGIFNGRGFYQYSPAECEAWKRTWEQFSFDIWKLAAQYRPLDSDCS